MLIYIFHFKRYINQYIWILRTMNQNKTICWKKSKKKNRQNFNCSSKIRIPWKLDFLIINRFWHQCVEKEKRWSYKKASLSSLLLLNMYFLCILSLPFIPKVSLQCLVTYIFLCHIHVSEMNTCLTLFLLSNNLIHGENYVLLWPLPPLLRSLWLSFFPSSIRLYLYNITSVVVSRTSVSQHQRM